MHVEYRKLIYTIQWCDRIRSDNTPFWSTLYTLHKLSENYSFIFQYYIIYVDYLRRIR